MNRAMPLEVGSLAGGVQQPLGRVQEFSAGARAQRKMELRGSQMNLSLTLREALFP